MRRIITVLALGFTLAACIPMPPTDHYDSDYERHRWEERRQEERAQYERLREEHLPKEHEWQ